MRNLENPRMEVLAKKNPQKNKTKKTPVYKKDKSIYMINVYSNKDNMLSSMRKESNVISVPPGSQLVP